MVGTTLDPIRLLEDKNLQEISPLNLRMTHSNAAGGFINPSSMRLDCENSGNWGPRDDRAPFSYGPRGER